MKDLQKLIGILRETRELLARDDNNFSWSSWEDQNHALSELDSIMTELGSGSVPEIGALFAPTGPIQEVSLSSGWGDEFIELAERFDKEYIIVKNQP